MTSFTSHVVVRPKGSQGRRRPPRARLRVEGLEDRIVPSYFPSTADGIHIFEDQLSNNLSSAMTRFVATHVDGTQKELLNQTDQFRAINPNFTVLHYQLGTGNSPYDYIINNQWSSDWTYVNQQESWFAHQSYSGEPQSAANLASGRVGNSTGWDQADISNPAWQQYTLNQVLQNLSATGSNGWFADSFTYGISGGGYDGTIPTRYQGTNAANAAVWPGGVTWTSQLANWAKTIETAFANYNATNGTDYQFIPNLDARVTSWEPDWYDNASGVPFIDGAFLEGFGEYTDTYDWTLSMNRGLNLTDNGKIIIMQPSPSADPSTAAGQQQVNFYLGTYLLLKGDQTYLNIDFGGGVQYYPQYDLNLGAATTPLQSNVSGYLWNGVYRRDFQNGFVLVNPGSTSYALSLGGNYREVQGTGGGTMSDSDIDANGNYIGASLTYQNVNSVTLTGGSAAIFLNNALTVKNPAQAAANPITATSVGLSVLGQENGTDAGLTYTWSSTGPGGVTFSDNGDNSAKNVTASFTQAGAYTFTATISDGTQSVTSSVHVTVDQTLTSDQVSPGSANLVDNGTEQFSATALDQFGLPLGTQPSFAWSIDTGGVGTVNTQGLYTAPTTGVGAATVRASAGATSAAATVSVFTPTGFTTPDHAVFTVGTANQVRIATEGEFTAALTANVAPFNFQDNGDGSATISGTPSATVGTYLFNITANNGHTAPIVQVFTLAVIDPPKITSPAGTTFTAGTPGSLTITSTAGLPTKTTFHIDGTLPAGVTMHDNGNGTATLAGTPQATSGAVYSVTISASNGSASVTQQPFTLTVNAAPAFTSASAATVVAGAPGSVSITTRGYPRATLKAGGLPAWLTFTDNGNGAGTLTGTPTAAGNTAVTLTATPSAGKVVTQTLTVTVAQPPTLSTSGSTTFTVGKAVAFTITASGGSPGTTTFSESGALPAGLSFSATGGTLKVLGTPAVGSGKVYTVTVTAGNGPAKTSQTYTFTVDEMPAFASAAGATFVTGQGGSFLVTTRGYPAAPLTASGLPAWLTFTDNGNGAGTLTGTPTAAGTTAVTLTATPSAGKVVTQTLTVTVAQPPTLSTSGSATFTVGKAGTLTFTASGGSPGTTTFSESGAPPAGLSFTATGGTLKLFGTPAVGSGKFYTVTVTAANGPAKTSQTYILTVDELPAFTSAAGATLVTGQAGSFLVTTRGFPAATLTASGLPAGLTFTDNGNGAGTLTGTPTAAGNTAITLTATPSAGNIITQTLTVTAAQPPTLSTSGSTTFTVGKAVAFTITASGGSPGTTTFSESGARPAGLSFTATGGTLKVLGTPAVGSGKVYTVTVTAGNGPAKTSQTFTLTVDEAPAFTSATSATFVAGQAGSFLVKARGFPVATLSISGMLPAGVSFVDNHDGTATLFGTPLAGTGGLYPVVFGSGGASQSFKLTVTEPPLITSAASVTFSVGQSVSFPVSVSGFAAPTLTYSGTLPSGMTWTTPKGQTGALLSGTPTKAGTYTLTIIATAGTLPLALQTLVLTVA
jgi:hypothetical protein